MSTRHDTPISRIWGLKRPVLFHGCVSTALQVGKALCTQKVEKKVRSRLCQTRPSECPDLFPHHLERCSEVSSAPGWTEGRENVIRERSRQWAKARRPIIMRTKSEQVSPGQSHRGLVMSKGSTILPPSTIERSKAGISDDS